MIRFLSLLQRRRGEPRSKQRKSIPPTLNEYNQKQEQLENILLAGLVCIVFLMLWDQRYQRYRRAAEEADIG
jgi:hypothetical protein